MGHNYSAEKDVELQRFKQKTFGSTRIRLTAHSFDGGEVKLQVVRQRSNDPDSGEWKFTKLGRLSFQEVAWLGRAIRRDVAPWMEEYIHEHGTKGPKPKKQKKGGDSGQQ